MNTWKKNPFQVKLSFPFSSVFSLSDLFPFLSLHLKKFLSCLFILPIITFSFLVHCFPLFHYFLFLSFFPCSFSFLLFPFFVSLFIFSFFLSCFLACLHIFHPSFSSGRFKTASSLNHICPTQLDEWRSQKFTITIIIDKSSVYILKVTWVIHHDRKCLCIMILNVMKTLLILISKLHRA